MSIPLTVIAGYLGAGKTTLLNNFLRSAQQTRVAVLINDFGDINIDAKLVQSIEENAIHLTNGCVCCTISDGFGEALNRLLESANPPDHIVLEASGVAEPARLSGLDGLGRRIEGAGTFVLVDAETLRDRVRDKFVGGLVQRQIEAADLIVLNKVDLVGAEARSEARKCLEEIAPGCRVVETVQAGLSPDLMLGSLESIASSSPAAATHSDWQVSHPFEAWSYTSDRPMILEKLQASLAHLPEEVVRAKGIVRVSGEGNRRYELQVVGRRHSLQPIEQTHIESDRTEIVFIAVPKFYRVERIEALMGQCTSTSQT